MRILFDARSVRTHAGLYVFRGLTRAWADDARVESVLAAVPATFDRSLVPPGIESIVLDSRGWPTHLLYRVPKLADRWRADVVFAPNGIPPRDSRSVAYFQDLFHFKTPPGHGKGIRSRSVRHMRAAWRSVAAPAWKLAIAVSQEIALEVEERVTCPAVLIPNGVDVGDRRWTGEDDTIFVMGGIGRRKGEATAIRAWARIAPSVRGKTLLKIGGVEPEARRVSLRELAGSLGAAESVSIVGSIPRELYLDNVARTRLAISCSTFEAFGLPVAEAIALGAPLLASAVPSHIELLAIANAGDVFAPDNAGELARKIEMALCGYGPKRLCHPPADWSWRSRGKQHIDAYAKRA